MTCPLNLLQFLANADHTVHQHPAVKLDLALAGATKEAATTTLALKVGPASHKTGPLKGQGGKLYLKAAGMGLRAGAENLQNQRRAVDDLAFCRRFQIALLNRAETRIDDDHRWIVLVNPCRQPVNIATAEKRAGARLVKRDRFGKHHFQTDGRHKLYRLFKHRLATAWQRHAAHLRMDDECCRCTHYDPVCLSGLSVDVNVAAG